MMKATLPPPSSGTLPGRQATPEVSTAGPTRRFTCTAGPITFSQAELAEQLSARGLSLLLRRGPPEVRGGACGWARPPATRRTSACTTRIWCGTGGHQGRPPAGDGAGQRARGARPGSFLRRPHRGTVGGPPSRRTRHPHPQLTLAGAPGQQPDTEPGNAPGGAGSPGPTRSVPSTCPRCPSIGKASAAKHTVSGSSIPSGGPPRPFPSGRLGEGSPGRARRRGERAGHHSARTRHAFRPHKHPG